MNGTIANPASLASQGVMNSGLLYHMARAHDDGTREYTPYESLYSMAGSRFIQGQATKGYFARPAGVRTVSFTGAAIGRLSMLARRRSPFGICFEKRLIDPLGTDIRPVHYLERGAIEMIRRHGVYPQGLGVADRNWIDLEEEGTYSFSWEEEWRLMGDLMFDRDSVVFLIVPTEGTGARFFLLGYHSIPSRAIRDPRPHMERLAELIAGARERAAPGEEIDEVAIEDNYLAHLAYKQSLVYANFFPKIRADMRRDEEREIFTESGEIRDPDGEWNDHEAAMFDLDNMLDAYFEDGD